MIASQSQARVPSLHRLNQVVMSSVMFFDLEAVLAEEFLLPPLGPEMSVGCSPQDKEAYIPSHYPKKKWAGVDFY